VAESARAVHAAAGYDESRMQVIHNGYDPDQFRHSERARHALRSLLAFADDDIVIGSVGRYSAAKDHVGFIRAAGIAGHADARLRFVLVGRDLTMQNKTLVELIDATGFPERFSLLGERADVAACMSAMDIFCLHSKTEGFPNVLGEAMCIGLPCISTDVGDAKVLLGETGLVVAPDSIERLAEALIQMARHEPLHRRDLGEQARQRIAQRFTLRHAVEKFEMLYR
jgi:glycosyltransferase involved in cell wall biosynthesis